MGNINTKKIVVCGFLLAFLAAVPAWVQAIGYGGLGGRPAFPRSENSRTESIFVHTAEPGTVIKEGVVVINNTKELKTAQVYAVDSTPSTGGAFACEQLSQTKDDVGAWIKLEKSEVTLNSGTNELVPFTITIPKNASVGEHNGCIIIQEKKPSRAGEAGVRLSTRLGLRVALTIPGKLTRQLKMIGFTVKKRDDGSLLLHPEVKNLGNVSIDADVKVITRYFFGLTHFVHGGQYPILRGESSDWHFELKKPFWGGWYYSTFVVKYDKNSEAGVGVQSGKQLTTLRGPKVWFFSWPTPIALAIEIIVCLFIVLGIFLFWLARKRKRWIKTSWLEYEIKSEENIKSLAEKFNVSWKLLAKVNKLQPPYAFKSGEKIKVPPKK